MEATLIAGIQETTQVVLALACFALTVATLGALRGVAELRLRLEQGVSLFEQDWIMAGKWLPASITERIARPDGESVILLLSEGCSSCRKAARLVMATTPLRVSAIIAGNSDLSLGSDVEVISGSEGIAVLEELEVMDVPVAIHQRDGTILGSARGPGLMDSDEIDRWLSGGGEELAPADVTNAKSLP